MPRTWLALDVNYLGYRALHSTGKLKYEGEPTGVLFGILRDIGNLTKEFGTRSVIACFDRMPGKREAAHPFYKERRRKKKYSEEKLLAREQMMAQLDKLRTDLFERIGVTNVLSQKGLEADDMMALACRSLPPGERTILVTKDEDMFQLLSKQVAVHRPGTHGLYTARQFKAEKGIQPSEWVKVKSLAGCESDDIPGIDGVGEGRALEFLKGEIKNDKLWKAIKQFKASEQYAVNYRLVDLLDHTITSWGCPEQVELDLEAELDTAGWRQVVLEYGMTSLVDELNDRVRKPLVRHG